MPNPTAAEGPLSARAIEQFIHDGFVCLEGAFSRDLADAGREILWRDTGCDPDDPSTWTRPVIRLGHYTQDVFRAAANTPTLCAAYNQLAGQGRWAPQGGLGTFPVRFPSPDDPGDAGWHVDMSFMLPEDDPNNFMHWRANVASRGRMLLMLFLFSDVGVDDAPTRLRVGSHGSIARRLAPAGEDGLRLEALAAAGFEASADCPEALATGEAGTVYLCHPFVVHAAQRHRGVTPRFMAQPPLLPRTPRASAGEPPNPVERAIAEALR